MGATYWWPRIWRLGYSPNLYSSRKHTQWFVWDTQMVLAAMSWMHRKALDSCGQQDEGTALGLRMLVLPVRSHNTAACAAALCASLVPTHTCAGASTDVLSHNCTPDPSR